MNSLRNCDSPHLNFQSHYDAVADINWLAVMRMSYRKLRRHCGCFATSEVWDGGADAVLEVCKLWKVNLP